MRAGRLRDRIDIERNTPTNNSKGEQVESWAVVHADVPAHINPVKGRKFYAAQQLNSELTVEISFRFVSGLLARDRIKDRLTGTYYEMVAPPINDDNRSRELTCMCRVLT